MSKLQRELYVCVSCVYVCVCECVCVYCRQTKRESEGKHKQRNVRRGKRADNKESVLCANQSLRACAPCLS